MASTQEATQVVLTPQRNLRWLFRAIVAATAALVVGMVLGNVIDSGHESAQSAAVQDARVVQTDEGLSELTIGARQITGAAVGEPRWIGASEELIGSLQAEGPSAPELASAARLEGLAEYFGPNAANQAAAARLSGLAEFHSPADTFSPELIWAVRNGATPGGPGPSGPVPNRPHGMQ